MTTVRHLSVKQGRWLAIASAFVLLQGVALPAHADDIDTRLSRIERDIDTLSRTVYKGEKPAVALNAGAGAEAAQQQLESRINQLEQDLRNATNSSEEQGNQLAQINRTLSDLVTRISALEQKVGGATASSTSPAIPMAATAPVVTSASAPTTLVSPNGTASATSPTVQPLGSLSTNPTTGETTTPPNDPTFLYENALELLKQRDYTLAEKSLTDFLKNYPNHQLVANAKYWLGETYFVQNRFADAAKVFAEGYQKYPKGAKAPDNLLKLGLSLASMNNNSDACVALKQVGKDFPTGAAAVKARADTEIKKLKCG